MSYNTRRGGNTGNFNKGVSSSQVGQRRPAASGNYGQNPSSQNSGGQQQQNHGYFTQQPATRQAPLRQPTARQPSAQQQMAKQQQMLVQKKQQLAQQQKQQQQKQQMVQQKQQANQKQQDEEQKKKELELQKQKELEAQRQQELELQKQKELELQKQKALELQKQKELEIQKQKELELQKQKALELQRQRELELQQQRELELLKQKELELLRQREIELQKQKELELQKQKELQVNTEEQKVQHLEVPSQNVAAEGMEVEQNPECSVPLSTSAEGAVNSEGRPFRRRFPQRHRKLSKYEIQRRRNLKLSKLLQPKSAMVILNEVGKNVTYNVERSQSARGPKAYMFKATVMVDGNAHEGLGLSKSNAKNEAAEKALKFLVKHKRLVQTNTEAATPPEDAVEQMETTEKEEKIIDIPLAWQQFASFAIYKLLDSWGEDLEIIKEEVKVDKKPAKKMPPNAELMNPLMLMNQMLPRVNFEELPRTSNAHFFTFNFRAVVDGKAFTGSGVSKKVAKKSVAFEICREVLGIQYPPEIYTPPVKAAETS